MVSAPRAETHHWRAVGGFRRDRQRSIREPSTAPQPTLVLAGSIMLRTFRKEWSGPGGHPGRTADRRIVAHQSLWGCVRSRIAIGSSLGPGWLKEPRVRITRKGRGR